MKGARLIFPASRCVLAGRKIARALLLTLSCATAVVADEPRVSPLDWSTRVADSLLERGRAELAYRPGGKSKWNYQSGCVLLALLRLHDATGNRRYLDVVRAAVDSFVAEDGAIATYELAAYNLDNINPGKVVLELARRTGEPRYERACARLRQQLREQPRTLDGGFWHKRRYPSQMWLDGVYMASPFLAAYGVAYHDPAALDDAARQVRLVDAHLYDRTAGLYYHGWDESRKQGWADKGTGRSAVFWSRGIGWYGMALADILDSLPKNHPDRGQVEQSFRRLCAGVLRYQDKASGVWYQVTDQGARRGNYLEATASAMFIYTLAKGVNCNLLDRGYVPAIKRAYAGFVRSFVRVRADGRIDLIGCCRGAGLGDSRPGTFEYYVSEPVVANDPKGVAPFILAGIEVQQLTTMTAPR